MKIIAWIAFLILTNALLSSVVNASVVGTIDPPANSFSNTYAIRGWACERGSSQSIKVHVYLGGPAGQGKIFKSVTANLASEQAVSNSCQSSGRAYRFKVPISHAEATLHNGKTIFVHGISRPGSPNPLLNNSGRYRVLTPPEPKVIGHIDRVVATDGGYSVRGWACQVGEPRSLNVHLYAGGAAGAGTAIRSVSANLASGSDIANACHTNGRNYRFQIPIRSSDVVRHADQKVFVHGISRNSTGNNLLENSGSYRFPSQIGLGGLVQVSGTGDVEIPKGLTVKIDRSVKIGHLKIRGKLVCENNGNYTIEADGILVDGSGAELRCGSSNSPFGGTLHFVLKNNRNLGNHNSQPLGGKAFIAHNGGTIRLHGKPGNEGFARLSRHAEPNDTSLDLHRAVSWNPGDRIVLASSSFDPHEAEAFTIERISSTGRRIYLDRPVKYLHWGERKTYDNGKGKSWTLDQRAEVANLTRSIKISSPPDPFTRDKIGAHMMIAGRNSRAFIDNVEFQRVGQMGTIGRYPFHWHLMGSVKGQYIKNSSIHESYHRCITIHGTDEALVQGNTCYDHHGHGFFLEHGNERFNTIEGNIGILSKQVPKEKAILISDVALNRSTDTRYVGPSTYWITNPANYVFNNVAAGSEGSGFWMSFKRSLSCDSTSCTHAPTNGNVHPASENTLQFDNNRAHSSLIGITHDGAHDGAQLGGGDHDRELTPVHYDPATPPVFNNLVAYKNVNTGIYYRGSRAIYRNAVMADNGASVFFAYDQELIDTLIVGLSDNHSDKDSDYYRQKSRWNRGGVAPMSGVRLYDGPFYLDRVHFADFPVSEVYGTDNNGRSDPITPTAFLLMGGSDRFVNQTRNLTFNPSSILRKIDLDKNNNWGDSYTASLLDKDGSLLNSPNVILRPESPMNDSHGCHPSNAYGAISVLKCSYEISQLRFSGRDFIPFAVQRVLRHSDSVEVRSTHSNNTLGKDLYNKFTMIMNRGYEYYVHHLPKERLNGQTLQYSADTASDTSPLIVLIDVGSGCRLDRVQRATSLSNLMRSSNTSFWNQDNNLYIKLRGNRESKMRQELPHARSEYVLAGCG